VLEETVDRCRCLSESEDKNPREKIMDAVPRLDKKFFTVTSLHDIEEEKKFWMKKTPIERLEAVELNRRLIYGEDQTTSRLQRFLETSQLTQR
jgi:hypothetical protein